LENLKGNWEGVDWIHLVQDRAQWQALVDIIMNLQVQYKSGNFLTSGMTISFSGGALLHVISQLFCNLKRQLRPTITTNVYNLNYECAVNSSLFFCMVCAPLQEFLLWYSEL
jgi:hypothetical protein